MKWTSQELDEFCKQAVDLLNKKKKLHLVFMNCWLWSNSMGGRFHVIYRNEFLNTNYEVNRDSNILEDKKIGVDMVAGLTNITDIKQKIILRLAYYIFLDCQHNMRDK